MFVYRCSYSPAHPLCSHSHHIALYAAAAAGCAGDEGCPAIENRQASAAGRVPHVGLLRVRRLVTPPRAFSLVLVYYPHLLQLALHSSTSRGLGIQPSCKPRPVLCCSDRSCPVLRGCKPGPTLRTWRPVSCHSWCGGVVPACHRSPSIRVWPRRYSSLTCRHTRGGTPAAAPQVGGCLPAWARPCSLCVCVWGGCAMFGVRPCICVHQYTAGRDIKLLNY